MQQYRVSLFVIILSIISGCAESRSTTQNGDGETHFLRHCDSDCEAGLSCICGVCTTICDSDDPCQKLPGDSECIAVETIQSTGRCEDSDSIKESICDVSCESDTDCESLDKSFICASGFCREKGDTESSSNDNRPDNDSGSTDSPSDTPSESAENGSVTPSELAECRIQPDIQSSCLNSTVIMDQDVNKVEKIDLLFVVDNSESMAEEQAKLRAQIPRMIKVLTTGDKTPDNGIEDKDFPPAKNLHLAVVSSDMGLPGLSPEENPDTTGACNGTGDDGYFLNNPSEAIAGGMNCPGAGAGGYPIFLEHIREDREDSSVTRQRAEATAEAFGCIATLGIDGCGYEMPLESALKALWPSQRANQTDTHQSLGISFLAGSQGHGDDEHRSFLRGTPYHPNEADRLSLLAIIVVTDEDDCSAGARGNLDFLSRNSSEGEPGDDSLRCYYDTLNQWHNKYPIERYADGFRALRPAFADLVVFSAIAGIPPGFDTEDANGDYVVSRQERDDFYQQILNHELMQETLDPDTNNLKYSCIHETSPSSGKFDTEAFPARRLTEVARDFGANGVIRSICADDFSPAMNKIIEVISEKIGGICVPRAYTRDSEGKVGCDIIWTMPPDTDCTAYPEYLRNPREYKSQFDEISGRKRCVVNQIPVINPNTTDPAEALDYSKNSGLGWYYDDFSQDMLDTCKTNDTVTTKQRISFTLDPGMRGQNQDPPSGVSVDLECLQQLPTPVSDERAGLVGVDCDLEKAQGQCVDADLVDVTDTGPKPGQLFCHDEDNLCVMSCRTDADCENSELPGWVCDDRQNQDGTYLNKSSYPICINPICDLPENAARDCGNSDVGEACVPWIDQIFSPNDIYIETNSPACETRICGVFGFSGNPQELLSNDENASYVQQHIHCTCRCRASDPDIPTCTCPDGFECTEDILRGAGPALAGGYCVRTGIMEPFWN